MLLEVMTGIKRRVSGEHQGLVRLMIAGDIIKCLIIFNKHPIGASNGGAVGRLI